MRPVMLVATRLATFDLRRVRRGGAAVAARPRDPWRWVVLQQVFDQISGHQPAALRAARCGGVRRSWGSKLVRGW
ncbi:hypothetical protein [Nonomuraea rubra]|uniref:hypothetical protein n=1 Tax=Nonomuraea rubra TaxID=46180 RepID=UPI0031EA4CE0